VSVKGEYLYDDFGKVNKTFASVGATQNRLSDHIVRIGANYKF
jgi:opacity protein-like surface antigen